MQPPGRFTIVLTADRTLMANYRTLIDGVLAANQTTTTPVLLSKMLLLPRAQSDGVRARVAPLGLRRIEAALLAAGFSADEVAVVHPDRLGEAIGPATRIVGISTGEPAGFGMGTTTSAAIAGGRCLPSVMFQELVERINALCTDAIVVAGGPGAWQLGSTDTDRRQLGIGHIVSGYAEGNVAETFRALLHGDELPEVIAGRSVPVGEIPPIRGASTMGVVEVSRGCGLGCSFCTISHDPMRHLPASTILADVDTNLAAGLDNLALISEDLFRYGAAGLRVDPPALIGLLEQVRERRGVRLIQTDHANVISVAGYTDDQLRRVRELMVGSTGQRYPWINVGVETAAAELLEANRCGAKLGPFAANWSGACSEQLRRLAGAGFLPIASLVLGLPGETDRDVRRTIGWVESLRRDSVAVLPVLYAPIDGTPPVTCRSLTPLHWQLIRTCYKFNFKWIPRMYQDVLRADGAGLARRALMRVLGQGQALFWRTLVAVRSRSR